MPNPVTEGLEACDPQHGVTSVEDLNPSIDQSPGVFVRTMSQLCKKLRAPDLAFYLGLCTVLVTMNFGTKPCAC
jgi:hypothetical protein